MQHVAEVFFIVSKHRVTENEKILVGVIEKETMKKQDSRNQKIDAAFKIVARNLKGNPQFGKKLSRSSSCIWLHQQ